MKRIGVLTSGGDCPGMNAAIRAIVRTGIYNGLSIFGIRRGYDGLIRGDIEEMSLRSVSGIINEGGTVLFTARSQDFLTREGQRKAVETIRSHGIDGLITIGGDGTFRGAHELSVSWKVPVIGVPATIDNDIYGTDFTIGFDTAVNTALEAIDRIRDTAAAHERLFFVEVMGRLSGFLALSCAIAGGAEGVLIPENPSDISGLSRKLMEGRKRGKTSSIVVVAEGDEAGGAFKVAESIGSQTGYEVRVSILGHLQRGGSPTAFDRMLASRLGAAAVEVLAGGGSGKMVGLISNDIKVSDIDLAWKKKKKIDDKLLELLDMLSI